jgi:uncharacterized protein
VLDRSEYPPGVPCWIDTAQPDPEAATRFYGGLFGWEFEDQMPAEAPGSYFMARLQGRDVAAIGSPQDGAPPTPVWNTYIAVDSADETAAKVAKAGGTTLAEPFDVFDAGRMGIFSDPSGAVFSVWQAKQTIGAQLVNEPGTWTSAISTPVTSTAPPPSTGTCSAGWWNPSKGAGWRSRSSAFRAMATSSSKR